LSGPIERRETLGTADIFGMSANDATHLRSLELPAIKIHERKQSSFSNLGKSIALIQGSSDSNERHHLLCIPPSGR
jgi:hypothetical protein